MTGIEYELLHAMEPILYIIRKQNRHSPTQGLQFCKSVVSVLVLVFAVCRKFIITCQLLVHHFVVCLVKIFSDNLQNIFGIKAVLCHHCSSIISNQYGIDSGNSKVSKPDAKHIAV